MVFSSHLPFYLDPPPNWQQHQQHQLQANGVDPQNAQLPPLPPPPHVGGGGGIRAGSMADRARLARGPLPEQAQKCPRCDSTNTKFCYYNNYSLSQPRHFCKACRRYWTRGGNLRNVPVGGGCRRNKKNKNNSSKSSSAAAAPSPTTTTSNSPKAISPEFSGSLPLQQTPHLPFLTSLPNFSQFGNLGLNFSGIHGHHLGGGGTSMAPTQIDLGLHHHQQQFPFFENPTGLYPFPGSEGIAAASSHYATQLSERGSAESDRVSQMATVKAENNNNLGLGGLNLSRPMILGVSEINDNNNGNNHNQFWGGNNWGASDLTGLNSSATNHLL